MLVCGAFRMTGVGTHVSVGTILCDVSAFLRAPRTLGQVNLRGQKSELSAVCHICLLSLSLRWAPWS